MTKADLRNGMVITCRNGNKYVVMKNFHGHEEVMFGVSMDGCMNWNNLNDYFEDLTFLINDWDVIKVEKFVNRSSIAAFISNTDREINLKTIWERDESKKKYTYAQIKEILGEEFEIVKE